MPVVGDLHNALRSNTLLASPSRLEEFERELRRYRMRIIDQHLGRCAELDELSQVANPLCALPTIHYRGPRIWNRRPKVSVIIPTRGDIREVRGRLVCLAQHAIRTTLDLTAYEDYEVLVVLDDPNEAPHELFETFEHPLVREVSYREAFSFADKCNEGFLHSTGDVIVFLNDDTEIVDAHWMSTLVDLLDDATVGMVGPLLLFEDGTIQSAGHSMFPSPRNMLPGRSLDEPQIKEFVSMTRRVSGLTAACVAIRRDVYEGIGGMSDAFPVNFNDVDLGLKLISAGYVHLWTGRTKLYHFESLTRSTELSHMDEPNLRRRWNRFFSADPFSELVDRQ